MADKIRVDTAYFSHWASGLSDVSEALADAARALNRVDTDDDWWRKVRVSQSVRLKDEGGSVSLADARSAVSRMYSVLNRYEQRMNRLSGAVRRAGEDFAAAESEIAAIINGRSIQNNSEVFSNTDSEMWSEDLAEVLGLPKNPGQWTDEQKRQYSDAIGMIQQYIGGTLSDEASLYITTMLGGASQIGNIAGIINSFAEEKYSSKIVGESGWVAESKLSTTSALGKGSAKLYDQKRSEELYKKKTGDGSIPKREMTILEVGVKKEASVSWKHFETEGSGEYGSYGASIDVGKAECSSELTAGLYVTKTGPDGEKIRVLEPGVKAAVGVSVSGITAGAHGELGNDNLGISGKASVSALKGSAKAETQIGFVDGDLSARVSASAEAILAEAKGEVALKVAGAEGKVTGSVNFGVGAHADVGYSDGKLVMDLGASLGVGASVKVELDVGGLVENAWDAVQNTVEAAHGFCESVMDNMEKAWNSWWKF